MGKVISAHFFVNSNNEGWNTMSETMHREHNQHYYSLLIMIVLSFISMFALMYSMANVFSNIYVNINQFYMAGLMTVPMVLIELAVMRSMYMNRNINIAIVVVSVVMFIFFFLGIRQQLVVTDVQFLRSMIPHHAGAILMCEKAPIEDPEIKTLCTSIVESQRAEIAQMKAKLDALSQ